MGSKETVLLVNSPEYDRRFADVFKELEGCSRRNVDCCKCPVESECVNLFDSLADKKTHYVLTDREYNRFMEHFKGLKKQLALC